MSLQVDIIRDVDTQGLPDDQAFKRWAELAAEGRAADSELCIRIVDAAESQRLNSEFRGIDKPTNVLSFPFEAPPGIPVNILGDLAICSEVMQLEAKEQGKLEEHHWAHLVIHGVLHLLGFDHIKNVDAEVMEALETKLLAHLGISDPYL